MMMKRHVLSQEGMEQDAVLERLRARKSADFAWREGRVGLYVYEKDAAFTSFLTDAYAEYFVENALGAGAFPSVASLENEIVDMALSLMQAPTSAAGTFTSGGSESIFLALKTARDAMERPPRAMLNIVIPETAHPAFDKAAGYLGLEVRRVPADAEWRADPLAMAAAIDDASALMVGSAPQYPQGVMDPITDLAAVATDRNVWLHVDACVGGFLAPFVRRLGYDVPAFEFSVPGVRSISADLHKYGMAARGASVLLLRDKDDLQYQEFTFDEWPRGAYSTRTASGSRPAGAVAAAWAAMTALGETGYLAIARRIMDCKRKLIEGIAAIDGIAVHMPSDLSILVIVSSRTDLDIFAVADLMLDDGWYLGRSMRPSGVHLALNPLHEQTVEPLLFDLAAAVSKAQQLRLKGDPKTASYGVGLSHAGESEWNKSLGSTSRRILKQ